MKKVLLMNMPSTIKVYKGSKSALKGIIAKKGVANLSAPYR